CRFIGLVGANDLGDTVEELGQPLGQGQILVGTHDTIGHPAQPIVLGVDHTPAGRSETGIKAEESSAHALSRSITSWAISKFACTRCTSSLSSSSSSSFSKDCAVCSSPTGACVFGFQSSRAPAGAPNLASSASR